eukprot:3119553-Pleurochrysis_carterae.AAC.2
MARLACYTDHTDCILPSLLLQVWADEKPLDRLRSVHHTVVHAMQNTPPSCLALKTKVAEAANKVKARNQARIDAADVVAATARNNRPHPPPPPRPTSGAKDTQPALGPSPPEDAPSNKLPPERKPPPSDDGRLAEMKARIFDAC